MRLARRTGAFCRSGSNMAGVSCVALGFVLSRLLYMLLGIRFDSSPLAHYFQYAEPHLLQTSLLETLYYFHAQPPLFNLFLGTVLKLGGQHADAIFATAYVAVGFVLAIALLTVLLRLGVPSRRATVLTTLFVASPPVVLYENWLFYAYPLAVMLVGAVLFLHLFLCNGRERNLATCLWLLAIAALTAAIFNIVWLIAVVFGLVVCQRLRRQRLWPIVRAAALPLLAILAVYGKNWYQFGFFGSSSWVGMSLAKMTILQLPVDHREDLVRRGEISSLALIPPFSPLDKYPESWRASRATGSATLDSAVKSSGVQNLNHLAYVNISTQYTADASRVLVSQPSRYAFAVAKAFVIYFYPASDNRLLGENVGRIAWLVRAHRFAIAGCVGCLFSKSSTTPLEDTGARNGGSYLDRLAHHAPRIGIFLLVVVPLLFLNGLRLGIVSLVRGEDNAFAFTVLFLCLIVGYVTVVGNSLEIGENNRFRFMIDPLFVALAGVSLERWRVPSAEVSS